MGVEQDKAEISTHTPLARRDIARFAIASAWASISTHTPLARRDGGYRRLRGLCGDFYSHASCEA